MERENVSWKIPHFSSNIDSLHRPEKHKRWKYSRGVFSFDWVFGISRLASVWLSSSSHRQHSLVCISVIFHSSSSQCDEERVQSEKRNTRNVEWELNWNRERRWDRRREREFEFWVNWINTHNMRLSFHWVDRLLLNYVFFVELCSCCFELLCHHHQHCHLDLKWKLNFRYYHIAAVSCLRKIFYNDWVKKTTWMLKKSWLEVSRLRRLTFIPSFLRLTFCVSLDFVDSLAWLSSSEALRKHKISPFLLSYVGSYRV